MAAEMATLEVNFNVRSTQNGKSVKINKEKQKLKIRRFTTHHFYKKINIHLYFFNLITLSLALVKKHFSTKKCH